MHTILRCENSDFRIPDDSRLLLPANVAAVRTRAEYLAQWIGNIIKSTHPDKASSEIRILSVGCGFGFDVGKLSQLGFDAFGIEPVDRSVYWAQEFPQLTTKFAVASDENNPFPHGSFDYVIALEVLEHVGTVDNETRVGPRTRARRADFIANLMRFVRPGGRILLTCPNRLFPMDFSHSHPYIPFSTRFFSKFRFTPTLPWSKHNFLNSHSEVARIAKASDPGCEVQYIADPQYFNFSRSQGKWWRTIPILFYLLFVRLGQVFPYACPHMVVLISTSKQ